MSSTTRSALGLSLFYISIGITYIVVSDLMLAELMSNLEGFLGAQLTKGVLFILVTGLLFFFYARAMLRRQESKHNQLEEERVRLSLFERRSQASLMASSIAHDGNNLLMILRASVEGALKGSARAEDEIQKVLSPLERLQELNRQLMDLGKRGLRSTKGPTELRELCQKILRMARVHHSTRGVKLELLPGPDAHLPSADADLLFQALLNAVLNGAEAVGQGGHVLICLEKTKEQISIEVHDTGPGFPDVVRQGPQAFLTTKPQGTGLGLISIQECAKVHQGHLILDRSELMGGALLKLILPVQRGSRSEAQPHPKEK